MLHPKAAGTITYIAPPGDYKLDVRSEGRGGEKGREGGGGGGGYHMLMYSVVR